MPAVEMALPKNLTVAQAHALHDEFESVLDKDNTEELIIHAESVARADTAGLQLMVAVAQVAKERQIGLTWDKPSEKLVEVASTLGLNDALGFH